MRILFTVTNDLNYDQRMIRICNTLSGQGHTVRLIGVSPRGAARLQSQRYSQKRISVLFKRGFGFYCEYNIRLFFYLLIQKADIFCCIDLDTMVPVWAVSVLRRKEKVYDAHEYFSQQKEIITRPRIYRVWYFIERKLVPLFKNGYTVSEGIAREFLKNYGVQYDCIRNMPLLKPLSIPQREKIILYRGSVNEGRGFEYLIEAMKEVNSCLVIYGDGNFLEEAMLLAERHGLQHKVLFKGKYLPGDLDLVTSKAYIGINLVEPVGSNQYLSLANKFFDYIHLGLPQVSMNFPEYSKINQEFEVALLLNDLSVPVIKHSLTRLLEDHNLYLHLEQNCLKAREKYNWQKEEEKLIRFYERLQPSTKKQ